MFQKNSLILWHHSPSQIILGINRYSLLVTPFTFPKSSMILRFQTPNNGSSTKEHTAKYFLLLVFTLQLLHGVVIGIQVFYCI